MVALQACDIKNHVIVNCMENKTWLFLANVSVI